jgi:glycolate oxidase FAD binding subunit
MSTTVEEHTCQIEEVGPFPVVQPQSVLELADQVRGAAANDQAVYPLGGRTMLDFGLPPTRSGIGLDVRHLTRVIDYPARDMTITVQAGITLANLEQLLATENQRLPIDVPLSERTTLGGVIAANISGPRRYGFGTLRDYLIGMSAVNDAGQEIKAGGRVVKNVAGYDLCKLFIGSLGTLGIITQVTLKLKPRPEEQAMVLASCGHDALEMLLDTAHRSRTRPVCLELLNQAALQSINQETEIALPEPHWLLAIGFEDNSESVRWQVRHILGELSSAGFTEVQTRSASELWQVLTEFPSRSETRLTLKANMLPSTVAAFCRRASDLPHRLMLQAHAGNGIVIGHAPLPLSPEARERGRGEGDLTLDQAQTMLNILHDSAAAGQGNIIVPRCPVEWKREIPVWGRARADFWLMRAVKDKLDPHRLFNPGRFVDGL